MLHVVTNTNLNKKRIAFFRGFMTAAVFALLPVSTNAQCAQQWYAGGLWDIQQSNGFVYNVDLSQIGKAITGTASYGAVTSGSSFLGVAITGGDPVTRTANVNGNIEGDDFYVTIGDGVYRGKVGPSGRIDGTTYDKNHPSSTATWFSARAMMCPRPPVTPSPTRSSGQTRPPAPPLNPPFITASQPIRVPNLTYTSVFLGWDSGPDHPNAEVWVSINEQTEISAALLYGPVLKQPRIPSVELKLQGGQYKYLLKDAGRTLSAVTIVIL